MPSVFLLPSPPSSPLLLLVPLFSASAPTAHLEELCGCLSLAMCAFFPRVTYRGCGRAWEEACSVVVPVPLFCVHGLCSNIPCLHVGSSSELTAAGTAPFGAPPQNGCPPQQRAGPRTVARCEAPFLSLSGPVAALGGECSELVACFQIWLEVMCTNPSSLVPRAPFVLLRACMCE